MGNFMRRTLAFILGMVFGFVVLFGGIATGAYWAFKNLTLGTLQLAEDGSDIYSWTIEDLTAFISDVSKDPNSFTLNELEKHGFDVDKILTDMGVDLATANPKDVESFKSLAIASIFNENGIYNVNLGVIFLFMPMDMETGKYPIFSEGARTRLRQYSLGDFLSTDENGNSNAYSILRGMKLGSLLTSTYDETFENGEYVYSSEDMGMDLFGNVELGILTDSLEGNSSDLGYEIKEGYLTNLKDKQLREIISSFGATTEEEYQLNYESNASFGDKTLDEIILWNEKYEWYEFDLSKLINLGTVGDMMGYSVCSKTDSCEIHQNVEDCDGLLYKDGVISTDSAMKRQLITNLCDTQITELMGGIDFNDLFEGTYLGSAFGYEPGYLPSKCDNNCSIEHVHTTVSYCPAECSEEHEHSYSPYCLPNCSEEHEHNFYYFDANGNAVGNMKNTLSNFTLIDALNGKLDIDIALDDLLLCDAIDDYTTGAFTVMDISGLEDNNGDGAVNAGDCPINEVAKRVSDGSKEASYSKLESAGIIEFDNNIKQKLNAKIGTSWTAMNINEILYAILEI